MTLAEARQVVIKARRHEADHLADLRDYQQAFERETAATRALLALAKADRQDAEAALRQLAIENFEATGNKQPIQGVGIRVTTRIGYDESEAIHWARQAHPDMLAINTKLFEKHAKAVADTERLGFVNIWTEATATIAKNLE